jgi:poly(beta-D-mannuronate) C5 epimerase
LKPLELGVGSTIDLTGPLRLELAPGSFILAQHASTLRLNDVTVVGVTSAGNPQSRPVVGRGFIDARSGALLQLEHDTFIDLGYLSDQSYGVTIDAGSGSSFMRHCTVVGDYFGVYLGRVKNVVVSDNRFEQSVVYGIDPHTWDSHLTITNNTVVGSGVHGIVVADHVTDSLVAGNHVTNSRDHGIVLFQFADHNVVRDNVVLGTFDALVVTDSSSNTFEHNTFGPATRFDIRLSGISSQNVFRQNVITRSLVGAYVYQGASANQFIDNSFSANYENIRIRSDAPGNSVTPDPGRSEL